MFVEEIRRAVQAAPRERLGDLSMALWKSHAAGAIGDDDAQAIAELIHARNRAPVPEPRRPTGSRPWTSASIERRRKHSAAGWMPPQLAAQFTVSEVAALSVIAMTVLASGRCELPIGAIAAKTGCCATVVRNALRQAQRLGLIVVEHRRVSYSRNRPNVVRIVSAEWSTWLRIGARKRAEGGGCRFALATNTHIYKSLARPAPMTSEGGRSRGEAGRSRPARIGAASFGGSIQ